MPLKLLKPLHEFAKTPVVKAAKPADAFILIPRSSILGRDGSGNIILSKSADVSDEIKKEDLDASGYGQDSSDQMNGDEGGDTAMSREEAMEHAGNLQKCRGAIMKAAGLEEGDMVAQDGGDPQQTMGEDPEAYKARVAAFRKARGSGGAMLASVTSELNALKAGIPAMIEAAVAKATGGSQPAPHKGVGAGAVVLKNAAGGSGEGASERELIAAQVETLKAERSSLIAKRDAKIALTTQEELRASQIGPEIIRLETVLMTPVTA